MLAYAHVAPGLPTNRTYLRRLDEVAARAIEDAPPMSVQVFSPDSTQLLFNLSARQALVKLPLSGGAPVHLAAADFVFRGDWAPDNTYYWTNQFFGPIVRIPTSGGTAEPVTALDFEKEERTHRHAVVLPGGKALMFTVSAGGMQSFDDARIEAFTLDTKQRKTLIEGGFGARYSRSGHSTPLPLPERAYVFPRIAADGRKIAFEVEGVNHDIYTYEPDRDVTTKMTSDGMSHAPVWTPRGDRLAFRSWRAGTMTMWWMPADRSGPEERLTTVGTRQSVDSFSPDGRYAAFNQMETTGTGPDVWVLPLYGDRKPRPFVRTKFGEGSAKFSPDGKWVAYCTTEPGRSEVVVQPWPGPGPTIQVSSDGGTDPIWSRDGTGNLEIHLDRKLADRRVFPAIDIQRSGTVLRGSARFRRFVPTGFF